MRLVPSSPAVKDVSLEAVRGVASIAVFLWHFFLAFDPSFLFDPERGAVGAPYYALIHGTAAVDLFFLLSGYVLTKRFFETRNGHFLLLGALKRWFRLMPLVLFSTLLSWVCYRFSFYAYAEASRLSGSAWLAQCGGVPVPPVDAGFWKALWQGMGGAFFQQETSFNSNLWTIQIEFFGSMAAFLFSWGVFQVRKKRVLLFLATAAALVLSLAINPHYTAFILGPLLAFLTPRLRGLRWPTGVFLFAVGFYLLGYRGPFGFYAFFMPLALKVDREILYIVFSMLGSAALIVSCVGWSGLNQRMQGALCRWLGQISFPLYLIHVIMICSLGARIYAGLSAGHGMDFGAQFVTALFLFPATIAMAWGLSVLDRRWVVSLGDTAARLYRSVVNKTDGKLQVL